MRRGATVAGVAAAGVAAAGVAIAGFAVLSLLASPLFAADAAEPVRIRIKNFMFTPQRLTVTAGATVLWENDDDEPHTVVSDTGLFRSGALDTHETFTYRFTRPGTYRLNCSLHPQMVLTVVVE